MLQIGYAWLAGLNRAEDLFRSTEPETGRSNPLMSADDDTEQPIPVRDPFERVIERFAPFLFHD